MRSAILSLLALVLCAALARANEDVPEWAVRGGQALSSGDHAAAEKWYDLVARDGSDPAMTVTGIAYRGLARAYLGRKEDAVADFADAESFFELVPAERRDKPRADLLLARATALLDLWNDPQAALPCVEELARLQPKYALAHRLRGLALQKLQRHEEGLAAFGQARALGMGAAPIARDRARSLERLGRFADAERELGALLEGGGTPADLRFRAELRLRLERRDEALADVDAALARGPDVQASRLRATLLAGTGRWADLLRDLDRSSPANPEDAGLACARGEALLRTGRLEEAVLTLAGAVAVKNDFARARELLVEARAAWAARDAAIGECDRLLAAGEDADARCRRGERQYELDAFPGALADAERALAQAPGHARARRLRGRTLVALGRGADALPDLEAAARALPRDFVAWLAWFRCLDALGRTGEAQALIATIEGIEPDTAEAFTAKAMAMLAAGNIDQAFAHAKRAAELEPTAARLYDQGRCHLYGLEAAKRALAPADLKRADATLAEAARLAGADRRLGSLIAVEQGRAQMMLARAMAAESLVERGGYFPRAVECFDRALALDPYLFMAILERALVHLALGRTQEAMRGIWLYRVSDPTAHDFVDRRLRYWQGFVQRWEEVRQWAAKDYVRFMEWWGWWRANASMCAHCHQWTYAGETHSCR